MPEPVFEAYIRTTRSRRTELATASALKLACRRLRAAVARRRCRPVRQFPPYALDIAYAKGDVPDYAAWLEAITTWS